MLRLGRDRRESSAGPIVAALDIGSARIGCLIASLDPERSSGPEALRVLALAQQRSRGVSGGVIVDMEAAQVAVRAALAEAEALARVHVERVHIAVNCGPPRSTTFRGRVELRERIVRDYEIAVLDRGAHDFARRHGEAVLALQRLGYRLDETASVAVPLGLAGRSLGAEHVAITVAHDPLHNLERLVERCHLKIASRVAAAHASALAATTPDERRLGVTCLDVGGETTTIAGYADGRLLNCGAVPVGGQHATIDLARGLGIPLAEAERIKALYGSLALAASDAHDHVSLMGSGGAEGRTQLVPKSVIGRILRHRMHGLLGGVREQLAASGVGNAVGARLVLTGGSCQLLGFADFVADAFDRPVRIGFPPALPGLASGMASASFSCLAGVVLAALEPDEHRCVADFAASEERGYAGRVERWLRDSF